MGGLEGGGEWAWGVGVEVFKRARLLRVVVGFGLDLDVDVDANVNGDVDVVAADFAVLLEALVKSREEELLVHISSAACLLCVGRGGWW